MMDQTARVGAWWQPRRRSDPAASRSLEELAIAVFLTDRDGGVTYVDAAVEEALGYSPAELVGKRLEFLVAAESVGVLHRQLGLVLSGTVERTVFEVVGRTRDGRSVPLQICSEPVRLWGAVVGVAGILYVAGTKADAGAPVGSVSLTPRQLEVLELLAEGLNTEAIAGRLTISLDTARNHIRAVRQELDCHTRLEAVVTARRLGLVA